LVTIQNIVGFNIESNSEKCHGDHSSSCTLLFMHNSAEVFGGALDTVDSSLASEGCNKFIGIQ